MRMTPNENEEWYGHLTTPVIFNHRKPVEVNATEIQHVKLDPIKSTVDAVRNKEKILILTPLRDASYYLAKYFDLLTQLTYPHELIDLAFLLPTTFSCVTQLARSITSSTLVANCSFLCILSTNLTRLPCFSFIVFASHACGTSGYSMSDKNP